MKRVLLFAMLALFALEIQAQVKTKVRIIERPASRDSTVVIRQGDTVIMVREPLDVDSISVSTRRFDISVGPDGVLITKNEEEKRLVTRFLLMDIGFAGFLSDGSLNMPEELEFLDLRGGKSRNVNLQLFTQRVMFAKNHMNFSYGLMFEFNKYRLQNDIRLVEGESPLMFEVVDKDLRKNKLKAAYLYIPIMFGVESKPEKLGRSFRARAGMYAGVLTSSKQKLIEEITDREKIRDDFNLNRFRYGIRGEMGYGFVNFYVHYSLAPMFKDGQGPELQPINFGIMLLPF